MEGRGTQSLGPRPRCASALLGLLLALFLAPAPARRLGQRQCETRDSSFSCLGKSYTSRDFRMLEGTANDIESGNTLETLKDFRGGSSDFYAQILQSLQVVSCEGPSVQYSAPDSLDLLPDQRDNDEDRDSRLVRFVPWDDSSADISFNGVCAVASDTPCRYTGFGLTNECVFCDGDINNAEANSCPGSNPFSDISSDKGVETQYCERLESCKWKAVSEGQVREVRYCDGDDVAMEHIKDGEVCSKDEVAPAEAEIVEWLSDSFTYLVVAVVLGIVVFLGFSALCVLRCCCNKCGGRFGRSQQKYTRLQKGIPAMMFVVCAMVILVTTNLAHKGNETIDEGLEETFDSLDLLLDHTYCFLESAKVPIEGVLATTSSATETAIVYLDESSWVSESVTGMLTQLSAFENVYVARLEEYSEYTKEFDLSEKLAPIKRILEEDVREEIITTFDEAFATLRDELVDSQAEIEDEVDSALSSISDLQNSLSMECSDGEFCIRTALSDVEKIVVDTSDIRLVAALALFVLSMFMAVLGLLGIVAGNVSLRFLKYIKGFTLNLTWLLAPTLSTLSFIIAGVTLLMSILWTDSCGLLEETTKDFGGILDPQISVGLNACFNDSSLLEAYGLEEELDFADELSDQFAVIDDVDVTESFSSIYASLTDVQAGIEETISVEVALASLNSLLVGEDGVPCGGYIGIDFELNTIRSPWDQRRDYKFTQWDSNSASTGYARVDLETGEEYIQRLLLVRPVKPCPDTANFDESVLALYATVDALLQLREDITVDLGIFGTDLSSVVYTNRGCDAAICTTAEFQSATDSRKSIAGIVTEMETRLGSTKDDFLQLAENTVGELIAHVDDFYCNMYCGFITNDYRKMHTGMCVTTLEGFTSVSIAIYVLAGVLVPFAISAAILVIRLKSDGVAKVDALNNIGLYQS